MSGRHDVTGADVSTSPEVAALLARVAFPPAGTAVVAAVSGGPDSSALLVLAAAAGCVVTAVHVDHGLRQGSDVEAAVVATTAERFGASFRAETVHVEPGPNLEARARAARYAVLPDDVMTGHTLDDRAETILLHLLRGTGIDGIATMSATGARRPLLTLRRRDTVELCAHLGVTTVDDPSNGDLRFRRNRVRHELLPMLDDIAGRDVAPLLARTGDLVAADVAWLDQAAAGLDASDARALTAAPVPLAARAVRKWLEAAHEGYAPGAEELARVMQVARGERVATELAGGWRVARSGQRLRLVPPR